MSKREFSRYKKALLYSLIAGLSLFVITSFSLRKSDYSFLRTSFLAILESLIEESMPEPPELSIESVSLTKTGEPTYELNYYKYDATIVIENKGGQLLNSKLTLSAGGDQPHKFITNNEKGFALNEDQKYIVKNYEVLFDGKYNGGEIDFSIDLKSKKQEDLNTKNNNFKTQVFEKPAKLADIGIKEILPDRTFVMNFEPAFFYLNEDDFQLFTTDELDTKKSDLKYAEIDSEEGIYEYLVLENSLELMESDSWEMTPTDSVNAHILNFDEDPFETDKTSYVYVKAVNPLSGNYVYSDVLVLPPQAKLNRAEFAKFFMETAGIKTESSGENFYQDVDPDEWYFPYVQTLFNFGLLGGLNNPEFRPEEMMTRGEALRILMDYFDADLVINAEPRFSDVEEGSELYPYVEGFMTNRETSVFGETFSPWSGASKNYLKYLINELEKDN